MSNYDALLYEVCKDPSSDVPRLVLADYLEERGDPRSEFIRVQCELVRTSHCVYGGQHPSFSRWEDCRYCVLQRREGVLLEAHWKQWELDIGDVVDRWGCTNFEPTIRPTFHRGFVTKITCPSWYWLGENCPRCYGFGWRDTILCSSCRGQGYIAEAGKKFVLKAPVERIRFTDIKLEFDGYWFCPIRFNRELFPLIVNGYFRNDTYSGFPSEESCWKLISDAAVNWARGCAGLSMLRGCLKLVRDTNDFFSIRLRMN